MTVRTAEAEWQRTLRDGQGRVELGSGAFSGGYSFRSRFEEGQARETNPEELIGAAHAGCFSMALAAGLTAAGHPPARVHTTARVHLDRVEGGYAISRIDLRAEAAVPGIDEATFREQAETAKRNCPVSKALAATPITLEATLV